MVILAVGVSAFLAGWATSGAALLVHRRQPVPRRPTNAEFAALAEQWREHS